MDDDAPEYQGPSENDRVVGFRLERLVDAGFPYDVAQRLSEALWLRWTDAVDLIDSGCDPLLAEQILT